MNKLSEDEKDEIIEHMNSDHPDAALLYLKHYACLLYTSDAADE